jgi:hypothetical protein
MVDAYESDLTGGIWYIAALACTLTWWAMFFSAWGAIA